MPVKTVAQKDIPRLLSSATREIGDHLDKMIRGDHQFLFGNRGTQCQPMDALRWFTEMIPETSGTLHIRNIMVNALSDSEGLQGASAVVCAASLMELLRIPEDDQTEQLRKDLRLLSTMSRRCSSQDLIRISRNLDRDPYTSKIAESAILGCSANAAIQIEKSRTTEVRRVTGHKFPVSCPDVFVAASHVKGEKDLENSRVLSIDGIVESMSEIDGVIQGSYGSRTPIVIIARGYSSDVQNTLGVNWFHGHLRAIPLIVPYDEFGANLLNDISSVTICDTISTFKGETISSRKWDDLVSVEKIRVSFDLGNITIQNNQCDLSVKKQRKRLRSARISSTSEMESLVFDRRLSCLMGEGVVIRLGEDLKDLRGIYTDRLNTHIRLFRSGSKNGVIRLRDVDRLSCTKKMSRVLNRLEDISDVWPATTLITGIMNAISCSSYMRKLGGIIYNDSRK